MSFPVLKPSWLQAVFGPFSFFAFGLLASRLLPAMALLLTSLWVFWLAWFAYSAARQSLADVGGGRSEALMFATACALTGGLMFMALAAFWMYVALISALAAWWAGLNAKF